jgi:TPR repeat protein
MKSNINELVKKSDNKDVKAMEQLALCYLKGSQGVPVNAEKGYKLLKDSAELGNVNALYRIAKLHLIDTFGIKDTKKAINLLIKGAKQNHSESSFELGKIYYYGKLEKQNIEMAEKYLRESAASSEKSSTNAEAKFLLAYIWENGLLDNYINMEESFKYYKASAEQGYVESLFKCGSFYLKGIDGFLKQNINLSINYLRKASELNHFEAKSVLARVYIEESKKLLKETSEKSEDAKIVFNYINDVDTTLLD